MVIFAQTACMLGVDRKASMRPSTAWDVAGPCFTMDVTTFENNADMPLIRSRSEWPRKGAWFDG